MEEGLLQEAAKLLPENHFPPSPQGPSSWYHCHGRNGGSFHAHVGLREGRAGGHGQCRCRRHHCYGRCTCMEESEVLVASDGDPRSGDARVTGVTSGNPSSSSPAREPTRGMCGTHVLWLFRAELGRGGHGEQQGPWPGWPLPQRAVSRAPPSESAAVPFTGSPGFMAGASTCLGARPCWTSGTSSPKAWMSWSRTDRRWVRKA